MRERLETWLKLACLVLAALVLLRLGLALVASNPLAHVSVPSPPALPPDSNGVATAKGSNAPGTQAGKGTNNAGGAALKPGTNLVSQAATNANPAVEKQNTNLASGQASTNAETNVASNPAPAGMPANSALTLEATNEATNIIAAGEEEARTNLVATNAASATADQAGTNKIALAKAAKGGTNSSAHSPGAGQAAMPPELAAMMGMNPMAAKPPELPPVTKAIIDRITDSEMLAPVIRPQPMALLGIAGEVAFLRTASGQTGMIKENETLGELKLLRIGINRVLVEQDGQKKELMIFSGYGGESLLPKSDTPNEITK